MGKERAATVATVFMAFENGPTTATRVVQKTKPILVGEIYLLIRGWCFARSPLASHGMTRGQAWTVQFNTWHDQLPHAVLGLTDGAEGSVDFLACGPFISCHLGSPRYLSLSLCVFSILFFFIVCVCVFFFPRCFSILSRILKKLILLV